VLALIEASGLVSANLPFEATLGQLLLEQLLQFSFGLRIAASARMPVGRWFSANKNVLLKFWAWSNIDREDFDDGAPSSKDFRHQDSSIITDGRASYRIAIRHMRTIK